MVVSGFHVDAGPDTPFVLPRTGFPAPVGSILSFYPDSSLFFPRYSSKIDNPIIRFTFLCSQMGGQQFPEPSEMAAPPVAKTLETPGHMLLPNWLSGI
jgi:hypothetical protein